MHTLNIEALSIIGESSPPGLNETDFSAASFAAAIAARGGEETKAARGLSHFSRPALLPLKPELTGLVFRFTSDSGVRLANPPPPPPPPGVLRRDDAEDGGRRLELHAFRAVLPLFGDRLAGVPGRPIF